MADRLPSKRTLWMHAVLSSHLLPSARLVGLTIGAHMDIDAGGARPSLKTIARETGLSYATVNTQLRELEFLGLLTILRGGGKGHPNHYEGQIPPFILARFTDKQSDGWTLSRVNSLIENPNSPTSEPKQSNGLTGSIPKDSLPKGASRIARARQDPDPIHYADNAWCRCQICLERRGVSADAS
jgi:hypothetical protein